MKIRIRKAIKAVFGTESNIFLKFSLSCFFTGIWFFALALFFSTPNASQQSMTFTYISGIFLSIWLISIESNDSIWEIIKELIRWILFFIFLIPSLYFCLIQSINTTGFKLVLLSIFSCIGIWLCLFYLISKLIDILKFIKNIMNNFRNKLFGSEKPTTSKLKSLIENATAFLVAIGGLGIALKTIVEPILNLIK